MGYFKQLAIDSSPHDEDEYMERELWEEQSRRENAMEIHRILEEDVQKHFDLIDSTSGK